MKAFLKNYRQSPRKVRLVADLVKGKSVDTAITALGFLPKRAAMPISTLILSAVANAKIIGAEKENLFIKELRIDKGIVMKRFMPRAMGRASRINKRTSHVLVVLGESITQTKENKKKTSAVVSVQKKPLTNKKEKVTKVSKKK